MSAKPSTIFRPDLLKDRVVVVTGGGTGIGKAIVEECAALGAKIAIGARKPERLKAVADALEATGAEVHHAPLDIRDEAAVDAWVGGCFERFGRIDVLVNNAGGQFMSPAIDIRPKGWRAVIDTNLNGTWWVTQAAAKRMAKQPILEGDTARGRVISIVANMWRGFPGMAHTGAARAAVVNLTQTLALEWAKDRILVNAVAPGLIDSEGLNTYPPEVQAMVRAEMPKHIPLKRFGTEADVAWAVVWLASEAGDFVTGETVRLDGGQALWGMMFPI
ncbi:MAG: SDR family oxidoreductase [Planctomycetota bacterium]|jgi:NAD(P)-dependent dehydrogenase (short-subunit alcohol dehydrogenase family)